MNMFIFLFTMLFTQSGWAFKLNLLESTLELNKSKATTATIINDSTGMIAIEATARIRVYNENGEEKFDTIAEDLVIIPSQMIINPNEEQVLSIRWMGAPDIPNEKAYRLLIEYVSISDDQLKGKEAEEQQAGINIEYRIAKSFYVAPKGAKPNVALQGMYKINVGGTNKLRFTFKNLGSKHQIAHSITVQYTKNDGNTVDVTYKEADMGGSVNFLAQQTRDVILPLPTDVLADQIQGATIVGFNQ